MPDAKQMAERIAEQLFGERPTHPEDHPSGPAELANDQRYWDSQLAVLAAELSPLLERIAELETTAQRWISADDRMPEVGHRVLIQFHPQSGVCFAPTVGEWRGDCWDNDDWNRHAKREAVSHWMPIPNSPLAASKQAEKP